jgi:hypothetical protein
VKDEMSAVAVFQDMETLWDRFRAICMALETIDPQSYLWEQAQQDIVDTLSQYKQAAEVYEDLNCNNFN